MAYIFIFLALVLLIAVYIILTAPSAGRVRANKWRGTVFCHRGLYGGNTPENSIPAFKKACVAGYGSELDVQFTKDKRLIVFHDDNVKRMCGADRLIWDLTFDEARALRLNGTGETIPTFDEVLKTVDGKTPLCVEIKNGPCWKEVTDATVKALRAYKGRYVVESFSPLVLGRLKRTAPEMIRGQLVGSFGGYCDNANFLAAFIMTHMLLNCLSRPDFVAYDVDKSSKFAIGIQRRLFHTPLAAWTVRDGQRARDLRDRGEMPIFEHTTL